MSGPKTKEDAFWERKYERNSPRPFGPRETTSDDEHDDIDAEESEDDDE